MPLRRPGVPHTSTVLRVPAPSEEYNTFAVAYTAPSPFLEDITPAAFYAAQVPLVECILRCLQSTLPQQCPTLLPRRPRAGACPLRRLEIHSHADGGFVRNRFRTHTHTLLGILMLLLAVEHLVWTPILCQKQILARQTVQNEKR